MARIRTIKPEFPQSESMGNVSRDARLAFIELWTLADDEGRLRGNSRMLASLLFPYDDDAPALIDGWLLELETEACLVRYCVEGSSYIQISNWLNHQKIDKASKSKIPEFREEYRILANPRECSPLDQGSRTKDQGPDQGPVPPPLAPLEPSSPVEVMPAKKPQHPEVETALQIACRETWASYTAAYRQRYGVEPVRNATVNSQIKQLVQRIGPDAPDVAAFYVGHNKAFYVSSTHGVGNLVKDCEALRTQWATGTRVTAAKANEADRLQTQGDGWSQLKREAREASNAQ